MAVIIEIFLTPVEAMNEPADSFFLKQLLFLYILGWPTIRKSLGVLGYIYDSFFFYNFLLFILRYSDINDLMLQIDEMYYDSPLTMMSFLLVGLF